MAATLQVIDKSGTLKKIAAANLVRTMGADAAWFSGDSSTVAINDYLTLSNFDFLVIKSGEYVTVKFVADSGGSDGQGTSIPAGLSEVKVAAKSGTLKGLRAESASMRTTKTDAYSEGSALSVNDLLYRGDIVVCGKSDNFTLKITVPQMGSVYYLLPVGRMFTEPR